MKSDFICPFLNDCRELSAERVYHALAIVCAFLVGLVVGALAMAAWLMSAIK
jgi:hypothetical protein